jgi:type I restriction enzyme M protein
MPRTRSSKNNSSSANLGFEAKLWLAADKLRSNMDAAEYKHVVLGLIFLKYISDAFEGKHAQLLKESGADPEDPDEYKAENVFWVPPGARWTYLQNSAKQPEIGKIVDDAMVAIERDNPRLKGVLPKEYARPALDKHRLGELIDLIGTIVFVAATPSSQFVPGAEAPRGITGDGGIAATHRSKDILGRVYEYFLGQFASAEGKKGGQFYTPQSVVRLLVEMLAPYKGRIYDPCCGSGGMFVQSEKFVEAHGGKLGDISIYGQESNSTTRRLAVMNLALRGIEADFGTEHADTFRRDLHPDLRADYVLANPPFNDSDWFRKDDDVRWQYGVPPRGNANFAWVQHFIHHLAPTGRAGFVLDVGSLSSMTAGEGDIRKNVVESGLLDCIVEMPSQLFYSTPIPVALWFISKKPRSEPKASKVLFIYARSMGVMVSQTHRELTEEEIQRIQECFQGWLSGSPQYSDIPGYCRSASVQEIAKRRFILAPGRYVGYEPNSADPVNCKKLDELISDLDGRLRSARLLDEQILSALIQFKEKK